MMGLTKRQSQCLDAIRRLTVDGVPPTYNEIAADIGLASKSGINRLVVGLRERGLVAFLDGHRHRTLAVIGDHVSSSVLHTLSSEELRTIVAHCAGILAQRDGVPETAIILHRIADRLPRQRARAA